MRCKRQFPGYPPVLTCADERIDVSGPAPAPAAALEAWPVAAQVPAPVAGQLRTWTSPTRAANAVCRVSVNSPPSPRAGAARFTVQVAVAVPRYRPPFPGTAGPVAAVLS